VSENPTEQCGFANAHGCPHWGEGIYMPHLQEKFQLEGQSKTPHEKCASDNYVIASDVELILSCCEIIC